MGGWRGGMAMAMGYRCLKQVTKAELGMEFDAPARMMMIIVADESTNDH